MAKLSDADALLAAVWASPHDDLPRLVYADFIEERGHPGDADRAEFIRLQIAREAAEAVGEDVADEAHWREEGLFEANKRGWLAGIHAGPWSIRHTGLESCLRGLPTPWCLTRRPSEWAPQVWPLRVEVGFDGAAEDIAAHIRSRLVGGAQELYLTSERPLRAPDFAALAGIERLDRATAIRLFSEGDNASPAWLGSLGAPRLRRLELPSWWPGPELVAALASGPVAPRLTDFECGLLNGAGGLLSLDPCQFPRLRRLTLWGTACTGESLAELVTTPLAARLGELTPPFNDVELEDFYRAVAATPLPNLKVLRLPTHPPLSAEVARLVCRAPHLVANLRELHAPPDNRTAGMLKETFGHRLRPLRAWRNIATRG